MSPADKKDGVSGFINKIKSLARKNLWLLYSPLDIT
jgi:hypothetical protein